MNPPASRQVREPLVDGMLLHQRREPPHDVEHSSRDQAVRLVIVGQHDQLRADFHRLVQRHAPLDAQGLRLVTGAGDDIALPAGDHRPAYVRGIQRLFDGREERIAVHVRDCPRKGINRQRLSGFGHARRNSAASVRGQDVMERWFRYVSGPKSRPCRSGCADMNSTQHDDSPAAGISRPYTHRVTTAAPESGG